MYCGNIIEQIYVKEAQFPVTMSCPVFITIEFLEVDEYPEHIKNLVQRERELEEQEKRQREIERNTCKVRFHKFTFN